MLSITLGGVEVGPVSPAIAQRVQEPDPSWGSVMGAWSINYEGIDYQVLVTAKEGVVVVNDDYDLVLPWAEISSWDCPTMRGRPGWSVRIQFVDQESQSEFTQIVSENGPRDSSVDATATLFNPANKRRGLALERFSTLPELPGRRTIRGLGLVSALQAASGFTAGAKGRNAFD